MSGSTVEDEPDSDYARLESQIRWYDEKSRTAQRRYKGVKIVEFVTSASVPILALTETSGVPTAIMGAAVIILEGLQQLFQWHHNWITYRSTCEALRHEKYSYLGRSGSYDGLDDTQAFKALVERVEALISTEHAKWISRQEYEAKKAKQIGQSAAG